MVIPCKPVKELFEVDPHEDTLVSRYPIHRTKYSIMVDLFCTMGCDHELITLLIIS